MTYEKLMIRDKEDVIGVFYYETKEEAEEFVKDISCAISPNRAEMLEKYKGNTQVLRFFDVFSAVHEKNQAEEKKKLEMEKAKEGTI